MVAFETFVEYTLACDRLIYLSIYLSKYMGVRTSIRALRSGYRTRTNGKLLGLEAAHDLECRVE